MLRYIVKRIINLIPVALIISIMLFAFSKAMPGDPIQAMIPTTGTVSYTHLTLPTTERV